MNNDGHGQFHNLYPSRIGPPKGKWSLLGKMLLGKKKRMPDIPPQPIPLTKASFHKGPGLRVVWLGHSTTIVEIDGHRLLIDPMLAQRASPLGIVGPKRFSCPPLAANDVPELDFVLITHDHYDHLDKATVRTIQHKVRHFYAPLKVGERLIRWGIPPLKVTELNWWDSVKAKDLRLVLAPSRHFSGRNLNDRNSTLWGSWIILGPEHRVYCSGDGGYSPSFKKIGQKYGPFHITLMECGQYNPAWSHSHMAPEEAIEAHQDLRGEVMIPIHWGAFSLSLHSWTEPVERALAAAKAKGTTLAVPKIGGLVSYGEPLPEKPWWR